MRIFQVIEGSTNTSVPGSQTWIRNLHDPLLDMGHDVCLVSAEPGRIAMQRRDPRLRDRFSEDLIALFRKEHRKKPFALCFAYLMDGMVHPDFVSEVRDAGVVTCNFSCNNTHQFDLTKELSPAFDYCLHSERPAADKFRAIGARPLWWPMASNPRYFKPCDAARTTSVSFVGGNYCLRAKYIYQLLRAGVDVQVFGPGWRHGGRTPLRAALKRWLYLAESAVAVDTRRQAAASARLAAHCFNRKLYTEFPNHFHYPTSDTTLISLYSQSAISLGFTEVYENHDPAGLLDRHLHLRDFEAPMCGALYCTGHLDEISEFFVPDKEVITYRNEVELVDKVKYYLGNEIAAQQIRDSGLRRARAEHTYQHRFEQLFKQIGLSLR